VDRTIGHLPSPSRREMLAIGALTPLGLNLSRLLASESRPATKRRPAKSCLLIFMEGGPSHIDTFDMKPDAPAEIRGLFRPIQTPVPGVHVCDHLPLLASRMHHFAQVRSVHHAINDHNAGAYYALTGRSPVDGSKLIVSESPTNFPPFGAVLSKLRPTGGALPDFIHIPEVMSNLGFDIPGEFAGFLGAAHDPLVTGDPSLPGFSVPGLDATPETSPDRLDDRRGLLKQLDRGLATLADDPATARMDQFRRRAATMIGSPAVRRAFDLSREPQSVRERYGIDRGSNRAIEARKFGGLPHLGQCALLARRMIEASVRLVTLVTGRRIDQAWDTHRDHWGLMKRSLLPPFDQAISALMDDLDHRGLLDETLVVVMGEFGRTPKLGYITSSAGATKDGRDHWPYCYTVLFAGAGVPGGLVYGASDKIAAYPSREPVTPEDIAATIYTAMGVDPATEIHDLQSKPYTLSAGRVIDPVLGG
jgi:Protein of unknown function (DUF1501)